MSVLVGLLIKGILVFLVFRMVWSVTKGFFNPSVRKKAAETEKVKRFDGGKTKIDDADFTEIK